MCGRYRRRSDKQWIAELFAASADLEELYFGPEDDVAPGSMQPVIRINSRGERKIVLMRWGFKREDGKLLFNARAESINDVNFWKKSFSLRRCIVPADSFYEWVRPESRPDDCPAWSRDRTCRPIGSTLGGQVVRQRTIEKPSDNVTAAARLLSKLRGELSSASIEADRGQGWWHGQHMRTLVKASTRMKEPQDADRL
jgi:hypothetical protein